MKIPDSWKQESSHKTMSLNTLSLIGISLMWGHMLGLISIWWVPVTALSLMAAYGSEISKRQL